MKISFRIGTLVLVLGFAVLLSGCVTQPTYSGQRVRSARDFEVVETSTKRTLSTREMVHLKEKVEDYLEQEGVTGTGDYYVKIFLGEEEGVAEGEWVVVRYTKEPAVRFSLLASNPGYYDPYYSTYAYDHFPFPYYGFTRLSFQYYDYPYYGYRHYPVSRRPHHGGRGHHGDRDRKPGGRPDRDRDDDRDPSPNDGRPSGALKPSFKPPFVPANVNRPPENAPDPTLDEQERKKHPPTRVDVRSRPRQRTITPGAPRPGGVGAPDFAVRRPGPTGLSVAPRPLITQRPLQVTPEAAITHRVAPRQSSPLVREVRRATGLRPSSASPFKPSAPRVHSASAPSPVHTPPAARPTPAPVYTAPVERTESRPEEGNSSSSVGRLNRYDGGHREQRR